MSHLMLKTTGSHPGESGASGASDQDPTRMAASLLLKAIPEDPAREGLRRTPDRFAKAFADLCSGYHITARDAVGEGIFPAEGQGLVAVRDIEFYSLCEHHMLPFWGKASVAYYPSGKILGLSKFPRLLERHARRLQVQERLSESIADDIVQLIDPLAVVVQVEARHLCMMMRGVEKQNSQTTTETVRKKPGNYVPDIQRLYAALEKR